MGTGTLGTPGKDSDRQPHVRAAFGDGAPGEVRGGLWACAHSCVTSAHPRPHLRPRRGGLSVTPAEWPLLFAVFRTPPVPRPGDLPPTSRLPSGAGLVSPPAPSPFLPRAPAWVGLCFPRGHAAFPSSPAAPVGLVLSCLPWFSLQMTFLNFASSPSL